MRVGVVLRVNDNAVRQRMRGVIEKILCDLATAVGGGEHVTVRIESIAGRNPRLVQIIPNTFGGQVSDSRRDIVSLPVITELNDARSKGCLSRCV